MLRYIFLNLPPKKNLEVIPFIQNRVHRTRAETGISSGRVCYWASCCALLPLTPWAANALPWSIDNQHVCHFTALQWAMGMGSTQWCSSIECSGDEAFLHGHAQIDTSKMHCQRLITNKASNITSWISVTKRLKTIHLDFGRVLRFHWLVGFVKLFRVLLVENRFGWLCWWMVKPVDNGKYTQFTMDNFVSSVWEMVT